MGKVTLSDIGKKVGVSSVTVHNALSGHKGVSDDMRNAIQQAADELGYVVKSSSGQKNSKDTYNIGIIIASRYIESNMQSFYTMVYQETSIIATQNNCSTMLEILSDEYEKSCIFPEIVKSKKVDGILMLGMVDSRYLKMICSNSDIPVVCFDFYDKNTDCDAVIADNFYGMYNMTNHLINHGHKKISFIGNINSNCSIADRYLGYVKSLIENGIEVNKDWLLNDRNEMLKLIDDIELPSVMPTAFACNCDVVAGKLIAKLNKLGIRVPEDISVVGFDNFIADGICDTAITTYEIDIRKMADLALKRVIACIQGIYYQNKIEIVSGHMVEKNSVEYAYK